MSIASAMIAWARVCARVLLTLPRMRTLHFGFAATLLIAACKMSSDEQVAPDVVGTCGEHAACTKCASNGECAGGGVCSAGGQCSAPMGVDKRKDSDETDVGCGGAKAPACALGKKCEKSGDCNSKGCSYKKVCIDRPSCTPHFGGDTCGGGEPDDPLAENESCCRSIELPIYDGAVLMDKYHVTAGRMRVFLDAVKGNVRGFVKDRRPVGWDPTWDTYVPNGWDVDPNIDASSDPDMLKRYHSSVWHQLGGTALLTRLGRDGQPFRYGCNLNGNGVHTYRMPDEVQMGILEDIPHKFPQDILDAKTLNCVTGLMLMAFCEWDWPGSRLPTYAETRFAWNKGDRDNYKYPWGNSPAPMGYLYKGDVFGPKSGVPEPSGKYGAEAVVPPDAKGVEGDPTYANWKYNYTYPKAANQADFFPDFSAYISAPGRFPKGNGPFGHADLAGNVFDLTSTIAGSTGQNPDDRELTWGRNGAWEGHNIPFAAEDGPWTAPIMRKYAKAGGRCVMPGNKPPKRE
jgi:hypothetical protein